jgi:hypothetical protein
VRRLAESVSLGVFRILESMASDVAITSGGPVGAPHYPELGAISVGSYEMLARDCSAML